jgi:hypothetical protein
VQDQVTPEAKSAPSQNKKKRTLVLGGLGCLGLVLVIIAVAGGYYYYLNERTKSYEKDAIQGLHNIADAQKTFMTRNFRYATIDELDRSGQLNTYGDYLKQGTHGYRLDMNVDGTTYRALATPMSYGRGGGYRSFYMGPDGIVKGADKKGLSASESDPPAY